MSVAIATGPCASGVRMPTIDAPIAIQMIVGPMPRAFTARDAKRDPTRDPTPPAEITMPSRNGSRCSSCSR